MVKAAEVESASKTVLVVDDEPQVLSVVSGFLGRHYNILTAGSGEEAIEQSNEFKGAIHLLLSDFQMVGMNGMELASQITLDRPNIKVLLMSGYPGGLLVLNQGWHFLAKPFIPSQLRSLIGGLVSPASSSILSRRIDA